MSIKVGDRIRQNTLSTGVGGVSLVGDVPGFKRFSDVLSSGDITYYVIEENDKFEVGVGIYGSDNLERFHVLSSSNNGNKIELGGSGAVFVTYPADKSVIRDLESQVIVGASGLVFENGTTFKEAKIVELTDVNLAGTPSNQYLIDFNTTNKSLVIGESAGPSNSRNTLIGHGAGSGITSGISNTNIGTDAGHKNEQGFKNVSIGDLSGPSDENASISVSRTVNVGYQAGEKSRDDSVNIGFQAGAAAYSRGHVSIGSFSGSGVGNYAFIGGYEAATDHDGDYLVAIGYRAAKDGGGESSVWIGKQAGQDTSSAINSIGLGELSGQGSSGNNSIYLGKKSGKDNADNDMLFVSNNDPSAEGTLIKGNFSTKRLAVGKSDVTLSDTFYVGVNSSTDNGIVVQGASLQSSDLTQWRAFDGLSLASVSNSGTILSNGIAASGQGVRLDSSTPVITDSTLYNVAGSLYWSGSSLTDQISYASGQAIVNEADIAYVSGIIENNTSGDTYVSGIAVYSSGQAIANQVDISYVSGIAIYASGNVYDDTYISGVATYSSGILVDGGTLIPDADKGITIAKGSENFPITITQDENSSGGVHYVRLTDNDTDNITFGGTDADAFQITASGEGSSGAENIFKFSSVANDDRLVFGGSTVPTRVIGSRIDLDGPLYLDSPNASFLFHLSYNGSEKFRFNYAQFYSSVAGGGALLGRSDKYWGGLYSRNAYLKGHAATNVPLTIDAQAAQSANLTEWKASDGVVVAQVEPDGSIATSGDISSSGALIAEELKSPRDTGGLLRLRGSNDTYLDVADGTMNFYCNTGQAFRLTSSFVDVFKTIRPISNQDLGRTSNRWPHLYGVNADFTGSVSGVNGSFSDVLNVEPSGTFRVYGSGDSTNGEWLQIDHGVTVSDKVAISTQANGDGSAKDIRIGSSTNNILIRPQSNQIWFYRNGAAKMYILSGGVAITEKMYPNVNNSIDLGADNYRFANIKSVNGDFSGSISGARGFFESSTTTDSPLTITSATSQTANLQEWRASDDTVIAKVEPDGSIYTSGDIGVSGTLTTDTIDTTWVRAGGNLKLLLGPNGFIYYDNLRPNANGTQSVGLSTQRFGNFYGVDGSFTGDLSVDQGGYFKFFSLGDNHTNTTNSQWLQMSASTQAYTISSEATGSGVSRDVYVSVGGSANLMLRSDHTRLMQYVRPQSTNTTDIGTSSIRFRKIYMVDGDFSNSLHVTAGDATTVPTTIQSAVAQSANLTEWQASDGVVVAQVEPDGSIATSGDVSVSGTVTTANIDSASSIVMRLNSVPKFSVSSNGINYSYQSLQPDQNGTRSLGASPRRWSNTYSVDGDFSNTVSTSGVQASGALLHSHTPTDTSNKLYNNGGTLMFNGSAVDSGQVSGAASGVAFFGNDGLLTDDTSFVFNSGNKELELSAINAHKTQSCDLDNTGNLFQVDFTSDNTWLNNQYANNFTSKIFGDGASNQISNIRSALEFRDSAHTGTSYWGTNSKVLFYAPVSMASHNRVIGLEGGFSNSHFCSFLGTHLIGVRSYNSFGYNPTVNSSTKFVGFKSETYGTSVSGVAEYRHFWATDTTFTEIGNSYGLYVEEQTKGVTGNYSIYTDGGLSEFNGRVSVVGDNSTQVPFAVKSAVSQSANLTEWRASDDVVVAQVEPDGSISTSGNVSVSGVVTTDTINATGSTLDIQKGGNTVLKANGSFTYYYGGGGNRYILQGSDFLRPQGGGASPFDLGGLYWRWRNLYSEDGTFTGDLNIEPSGSLKVFGVGDSHTNTTDTEFIDIYHSGGHGYIVTDQTGTGGEQNLIIGQKSQFNLEIGQDNGIKFRFGTADRLSINQLCDVSPLGANKRLGTGDSDRWNEFWSVDGNFSGSVSGARGFFESATTTDSALTITSATSQTANLTEWKNSSDETLTRVTSDGSVHVSGDIVSEQGGEIRNYILGKPGDTDTEYLKIGSIAGALHDIKPYKTGSGQNRHIRICSADDRGRLNLYSDGHLNYSFYNNLTFSAFHWGISVSGEIRNLRSSNPSSLGQSTSPFAAGYLNSVYTSGVQTSGVLLNSHVPTVTTNTLYNDGGTLMFNGSAVGGGGGVTGTPSGVAFFADDGSLTDNTDFIVASGNDGRFVGVNSDGAPDRTLVVGNKKNLGNAGFKLVNYAKGNALLEIVATSGGRTAGVKFSNGTNDWWSGPLQNSLAGLGSRHVIASYELDNTKSMVYDTNGNVVIGGTSPSARLHVNAFNSSSVNSIFQATSAQSANITEWRASDGVAIASVSADGSIASSGNIGASGSIGIGMFTAGDRLTVAGNLSTKHINQVTNALRVTHNSNDVYLSLYKRANQSTPEIKFGTAGDSYFNAGNLGIGTTSPNAMLDVNGMLNASGVGMMRIAEADYPSYQEGTFFYDDESHALAIYNDESETIQRLGQEGFLRIRNNTAETIDTGCAVLITGAHGASVPTVSGAIATSEANSQVVGLANHPIESNSFGYITTFGKIVGIDTSQYSEGDEIFLSSENIGSGVSTSPVVPNYKVSIGHCINSHANNGSVMVQLGHPKLGGGDTKSVAPVHVSGIPFVSGVANEGASAVLMYEDGFEYSQGSGLITNAITASSGTFLSGVSVNSSSPVRSSPLDVYGDPAAVNRVVAQFKSSTGASVLNVYNGNSDTTPVASLRSTNAYLSIYNGVDIRKTGGSGKMFGVQNPGNETKFKVDTDGEVALGSTASLYSYTNLGTLDVIPKSTSFPGIAVIANASQTANLQEWKASDEVNVATVAPDGSIASSGDISASGDANIGGVIYTDYIRNQLGNDIQIGGQASNWIKINGSVAGQNTARIYSRGNDFSITAQAGFGNGKLLLDGVGGAYLRHDGDTKLSTTTTGVSVDGHFTATSKSFLIDHPTKKDAKLQYASLEGPEHGVYVRGRVTENVIELPDHWVGLVDEESITVQLTAKGHPQPNMFVSSIVNNKVYISSDVDIDAFYNVYAERKDIDKLEVEIWQ